MRTVEKKRKAATPLSLISLLGGESIVNHPVRSEFDLISLSNEGLSKASVDALVDHLGISRKAFSENILDISVKTLERKKITDKLDKRTSSHVIEIAKVVEHAFEVFEDEDSVKQWLNTANRALGGIKPIDLFYIPTGLGLVDDILGRIEYGVYS
ncbi:MAG TPA: antitoxin Xre/MbcA/ParS toxin-binding domain-containing protein [Mucilaginibacter sp.]|nr:antitoxin Xre/MbcA/ParS toxin-binding domain-containing protein [Mucilaginibacter sp.]